jgi:hypothetical protein
MNIIKELIKLKKHSDIIGIIKNILNIVYEKFNNLYKKEFEFKFLHASFFDQFQKYNGIMYNNITSFIMGYNIYNNIKQNNTGIRFRKEVLENVYPTILHLKKF